MMKNEFKKTLPNPAMSKVAMELVESRTGVELFIADTTSRKSRSYRALTKLFLAFRAIPAVNGIL